MCGILGVINVENANQVLYDSLQMLQHRGQDAAGILTTDSKIFYSHKSKGLITDIFRTRNMLNLIGSSGIAHVRYPTAGDASSLDEVQPFYVNSPFGIAFVHNGNLINTKDLVSDVINQDLRHINTHSDSEILLNVFAHELERSIVNNNFDINNIFSAVNKLHKRVNGAYAVVSIISGFGLVAFRDPFGIRPLILGSKKNKKKNISYMVASESVAFNRYGYKIERNICPGEAIFIDFNGNMYSKQCANNPSLNPCLFEYVYFARPDSTIDGVSVYHARLKMGEILSKKILKEVDIKKIDVIMPIPDTSRPIALELARSLNLPYREGLMKNRYIGRTFIMPGQEIRRKSVLEKLNPIDSEFKDKNVLIVDDSIVRGTTSKEIVEMAKSSGAKKVYLASAAPEIRFPNVYGINMPTKEELIANNKNDKQIANEIGSDAIIFQDLNSLIESIKSMNSKINSLETSCFNGIYITGGINNNND